MKIVVCENKKEIINNLENLILLVKDKKIISDNIVVDFITNTFDLYTYIDEKNELIDVVFINLNFDNKNGIDIGKKILEKQNNIKLIFIAENNFFIENIFDINTFGLLMNPLKIEKVEKLLIRCSNAIKDDKKKYITIKNKQGLLTIDMKSIVYIESFGRYLKIYDDNGEMYQVIMTMDGMLKKLNDDFVKCHRSFIINMDKIRKISSKYVNLVNEIEIPISQKNFNIVNLKYSQKI